MLNYYRGLELRLPVLTGDKKNGYQNPKSAERISRTIEIREKILAEL